MQSVAGIAHIDQMCACVGERDYPVFVLKELPNAFVPDIQELAEECGLEIFFEREVEHEVEGIDAAFRRDLRNGAVLEGCVFRLRGRADEDLLPGALEDRAYDRVLKVLPETVQSLRSVIKAMDPNVETWASS